MLEGLEAIDWKSYSAESMPKWIKALTTPDQRVRIDLYNALEMIFHPLPTGVVEEMDAVAIQKLLEGGLPILIVPFLIELLQSEAVEWKHNILQLLDDISRYREYVESEADWQQAMRCFEAVKIGMPIYQNLSKDADLRVKRIVAQLIERLNAPDDSI